MEVNDVPVSQTSATLKPQPPTTPKLAYQTGRPRHRAIARQYAFLAKSPCGKTFVANPENDASYCSLYDEKDVVAHKAPNGRPSGKTASVKAVRNAPPRPQKDAIYSSQYVDKAVAQKPTFGQPSGGVKPEKDAFYYSLYDENTVVAPKPPSAPRPSKKARPPSGRQQALADKLWSPTAMAADSHM